MLKEHKNLAVFWGGNEEDMALSKGLLLTLVLAVPAVLAAQTVVTGWDGMPSHVLAVATQIPDPAALGLIGTALTVASLWGRVRKQA